MVYNINFEEAAIALLVVLNVYVRLQYNSKPLTNRLYKQLALIMLAAVTLDVATATTISHADTVPVWLNMSLNFLYFCSDIYLEYKFVIYSMICSFEKRRPVITITARAAALACVFLLVVNFFTGWVFTFKNGVYEHGPVYPIVFALPLCAIAATSGILFAGFKKFNVSQRVSVIIYTLIAIAGPVVQLLHPDILFTLFGVALGFMTLTFSMETPDYQALHQAMDELRDARDKAEAALNAARSANKAKSEFLTAVSHEIRTPINAVIGYAEAISRETSEEISSAYSGNVIAASKRLLSMVNDILDYTQMETGQFSLQTADYSTAELLMDVLSCGEYYADKSNIEFRVNIAENIPRTLHGDLARLVQIMDNLLSNAAKYTEKGYIELGIDWETLDNEIGRLKVYVKDTGVGMKFEDLNRITACFVRLNREGSIPGLGLGLTLVSHLLTCMGTKLVVDSEYGTGTVMSFVVEQMISDSRAVGAIDSAREKDASVKLGFTAPEAQILVVDDNLINLELSRHILAETGAAIDTAMNGKEALELIEARHYDIIFMDHMMPVMNGLEALKEIRARYPELDTPIVVVTANAVSGEREMYLEAGFDEYMTKPVTTSRLGEVMKRFLPEALMVEKEPASGSEKAPAAAVQGDVGLLTAFSFLNTETGLMYCCSDVEFYLQIITAFFEEDKTEGIMKSFGENDLENYRIQVHSLKGTARSIGADYISEEARRLEMAARENNTDYISENTERVMKEYGELLSEIKAALKTIGRAE